MAKIPAISRLVVEDFPDQKDWIGKLLAPINTFLAAAVYALTAHLTFGDNLLGQENVLDFTYQAQTLPVKFLLKNGVTAGNLMVAQAFESLTTPIAVVLAWEINQNGQVLVTDISKVTGGVTSALTIGNRYQIRVRVAP